MLRPKLEVADIFRRHGDAWRKNNAGHVSRGQLRVMSAIEACRTAALGGHVERCDDCAHTRISYNSCRNRHCPKCQWAAAQEWLEAREAEQPMPFERLEEQEATGFLLKIVATLPPRQQEVLQLKFQNDLSYQQIAEITKTTANNVGVLIHTALKTLRQKYANTAKDFVPFTPRTTNEA